MSIPKGFETRYGEHEKRTVRESVATMVSIVPVDYTVSDDLSNNIATVNATTPPTMNLVTNPGIEVNTDGWTAAGSTMTRQTSQQKTGAASLRCVPAGSAAGEGAYYDLGVTEPGSYALSAYFRRSSGSGDTVNIRASIDSGATFTSGTSITLGTAWARSTLIFRIRGQPVTSLRIYVTTATSHSTTFFVDDIQVEPN